MGENSQIVLKIIDKYFHSVGFKIALYVMISIIILFPTYAFITLTRQHHSMVKNLNTLEQIMKKNSEFSLWKKLRKPDQTILKYFGLVSQLGLSFISSFLLLFFLFLYLDKKLGANGILLIIGTILGVGAGIFSAYKILKKYYEKQ